MSERYLFFKIKKNSSKFLKIQIKIESFFSFQTITTDGNLLINFFIRGIFHEHLVQGKNFLKC